MQRFIYSDLVALACACMRVPVHERAVFIKQVFSDAQSADYYRQRAQRFHSEYGDGTVAAATHRFSKHTMCDFDNPDFCACVIMILTIKQQSFTLP